MKKLLLILLLVCMSFLPALVFGQTSPVNMGGGLSFGYIQELDVNIVDFDMAIYISQEEKFGGSVFAGFDTYTNFFSSQYSLSDAPHFHRCMVGGTFNYDALYMLVQGYCSFDNSNAFGNPDFQAKLAVGINHNMPYLFNNSSPFFDVGVDFSVGYLTDFPDSLFTTLDVALYIRSSKQVNGVVFGGVEVLMEPASKYSDSVLGFCPYQDRYSFGVALNVAVLSLKVEHYCIHSVWSCDLQFSEKFYVDNITKISVGLQMNLPFRVKRIGR